jgi:biotin operon repressor
VNEDHGGERPPDAVLRPDEEPVRTPSRSAPRRSGRRGERFAILNAFADVSLAMLTGAEVKVWLILFRDTKAATGTARTGQVDIARRAGLSSRAVKGAVRSLKAKGLLTVVRRGRLNAGPSTYRAHSTGTEAARS